MTVSFKRNKWLSIEILTYVYKKMSNLDSNFQRNDPRVIRYTPLWPMHMTHSEMKKKSRYVVFNSGLSFFIFFWHLECGFVFLNVKIDQLLRIILQTFINFFQKIIPRFNKSYIFVIDKSLTAWQSIMLSNSSSSD